MPEYLRRLKRLHLRIENWIDRMSEQGYDEKYLLQVLDEIDEFIDDNYRLYRDYDDPYDNSDE